MPFLDFPGQILRPAVEWCLRHPLGRGQWLAAGAWLGALACGMILLGGHIARTANADVERSDQAAYLRLAEEGRPMWWPTATDGIRNPLFPWLLARVAQGSQTEMFEAGMRLNVWCGAALAIALGVWAGRRMAWLPAITFTSISGLGVILPISTFVGAEVLFYGLYFAAWMTALSLLDRLTLSRCALAGVILALAYLAKPGVTLFCGSFAVAALGRWLAQRRAGALSGWQGARPLLGVVLALAVALPIVLPRLVDASQRFGDPFQNTAANCFWEEDWEACLPRIWLLNPRKIHHIPPAERPTAARYLARNGWAGAWTRLTRGMKHQTEHILSIEPNSLWLTRTPSPTQRVRRIFPYRGCVLLLPLILTAGLAVASWRRLGDGAIAPGTWYQAGFVLLLIGVSFTAFSWYWPIAEGARFILVLYIPLFGSLIWAAEVLRGRLAMRWVDAVCAAVWLTMLAVFLIHIGIIATHPYFGPLKSTF